MDWYNLGVLIYELFTGDPPFFAKTQEEIFFNIQNNELQFPENIPDVVQDLITKLMKKNPQKRLTLKSSPNVKEHPWFNDIGKNINNQIGMIF